MYSVIRHHLKLTALLLTVIYCGMFVNGNFFPHQHQVAGGKVVHSHPFSNPHHGHSAQALEVIYLLTHSFALPGEGLHFLKMEPLLTEVCSMQGVLMPSAETSFQPPLRAPPTIEY